MNEIRDLLTLLEQYEGRGWTRAIPASEEDVAKAEQDLEMQFSDEYRQFLLYSQGGELHHGPGGFLLFDISDLVQLNPHPIWSPDLPGALFFASDNGDYVCYFDTENHVGRGAWAVYGVEMGCSDFESSIYIAEDLKHFVERVLSGEKILDAPYLKDEGFSQDQVN